MKRKQFSIDMGIYQFFPLEDGTYFFRNLEIKPKGFQDFISDKIEISSNIGSVNLEAGNYETYGPILNVEVFNEIREILNRSQYQLGYYLPKELRIIKRYIENQNEFDDLKKFIYGFTLYVLKYDGLAFSASYFYNSLEDEFVKSLKEIYRPNQDGLSYYTIGEKERNINLIVYNAINDFAPGLELLPTFENIVEQSTKNSNSVYRHKIRYKYTNLKFWGSKIEDKPAVYILIAHGVKNAGIQMKNENNENVIVTAQKVIDAVLTRSSIEGIILLNCFNKEACFNVPDDSYVIYNDLETTRISGSIGLFIYHFFIEYSLTNNLGHAFSYSKSLARFYGSEASNLKISKGNCRQKLEI